MTLERFNHILFAILGTLGIGLCLLMAAIAVYELLPSFSRHDEPALDVAESQPAAESGESADDGQPSAQPQVATPKVLFCSPERVARSGMVLVPVADPAGGRSYDDGKLLGSGSRSSASSICNLHGHPPPQNVIAVSAGGEQRFVFGHRVLIEALHQPDPRCEHGEVPCELLLWQVRDADTNGDGKVSQDDAMALLATDLEGRNLRRLSPPGTELHGFLRQADRLVLTVQVDLDGDRRFGAADPLQVMEVPARALRAELPADYDATSSPAVPLLDPEVAHGAEGMFG